jgi:hypothetical protein
LKKKTLTSPKINIFELLKNKNSEVQIFFSQKGQFLSFGFENFAVSIKKSKKSKFQNSVERCASRARVNLPHIGKRECFKFVLQNNSSSNLSKSEFVWEVGVNGAK